MANRAAPATETASRFHFPSAYTILFALIVIIAGLTWVIPAGQYERVASEALFAPAFLKEWVMQGRPQAHPAFADYLEQLARAPQPHPAPPMPPASRTAKEPLA